MPLSSTFWFYALPEGPPTCLRKGRQITQIDHECLCWWNCMYQIYSTLMICSNILFLISFFRMMWDFNFAFIPYGLRWRKLWKLFHENFLVGTVDKYLPIQRREVHSFLRRLLITPDNFLHHIRQ